MLHQGLRLQHTAYRQHTDNPTHLQQQTRTPAAAKQMAQQHSSQQPAASSQQPAASSQQHTHMHAYKRSHLQQLLQVCVLV
jgi:cell division septation protein DedD